MPTVIGFPRALSRPAATRAVTNGTPTIAARTNAHASEDMPSSGDAPLPSTARKSRRPELTRPEMKPARMLRRTIARKVRFDPGTRSHASSQSDARREPKLLRSGFISQGTLRSEEHTSELQSRGHLVCRLLLEKKKQQTTQEVTT